MNERIKRLSERLRVDHFQICVEKAALVVESLRETEGEPEILRRAKATANFLDNKTVFIEDDELIVGNVASNTAPISLILANRFRMKLSAEPNMER